MGVIAKVSAAPPIPKPTDHGTEIASQLSGAAIDVDERKVKQMLSTVLRRQRRRPDDGFPSQLRALEDLFLTLRSMALTDDLGER
jgi:hypothetical protein